MISRCRCPGCSASRLLRICLHLPWHLSLSFLRRWKTRTCAIICRGRLFTMDRTVPRRRVISLHLSYELYGVHVPTFADGVPNCLGDFVTWHMEKLFPASWWGVCNICIQMALFCLPGVVRRLWSRLDRYFNLSNLGYISIIFWNQETTLPHRTNCIKDSISRTSISK